MDKIFEEMTDIVIKGNFQVIADKVQEAVDQGIDAHKIVNVGLMPGLNEVGDRFAKGKAFVPNLLISAKAMTTGLEIIRPMLEGSGDTTIGTAIAGTVKGDLHDIGKNLVCMMMRSANINVIDLGSSVPAEKFVEAIKENHPDIVVMSALLTSTMNEQGRIIQAIADAGLRDQVKIMVGGAPVTQEWSDKIGADAFTADAAEAASWAKNYLKNK